MKVNVLLMIVLGIFICSCSDNKMPKKNDLEKMNLNGKVKSLKEFSYEAIDKYGEIIKGEWGRDYMDWDIFISFNINGYKEEVNYYGINGILWGKETYGYNDNGFLILRNRYIPERWEDKYDLIKNKSRIINWSNPDGNLSSEYYYTYDSANNLIRIREHRIDEISSYTTDYENNITIWQERHPNQDSYFSTVYDYDNNGFLIMERSYDGRHKVFFYENTTKSDNYNRKITFINDVNGNAIEELWYDYKDSLSSKTTTKYGNKGENIEVIFYNSSGKMTGHYAYKYDAYDNLIEEDEIYRLLFRYDKGNQEEITDLSLLETLLDKKTYKYEYDNMNNWIRRIEYENEFPRIILERVIEYY